MSRCVAYRRRPYACLVGRCGRWRSGLALCDSQCPQRPAACFPLHLDHVFWKCSRDRHARAVANYQITPSLAETYIHSFVAHFEPVNALLRVALMNEFWPMAMFERPDLRAKVEAYRREALDNLPRWNRNRMRSRRRALRWLRRQHAPSPQLGLLLRYPETP